MFCQSLLRAFCRLRADVFSLGATAAAWPTLGAELCGTYAVLGQNAIAGDIGFVRSESSRIRNMFARAFALET